ncbi:MAG: CHAT domain-containing protein, partial [Tepidiformaceae bacterium]
MEAEGTSYQVRVLDSPGGQAEAQVTLPFSDLELENFILRLGQRGRSTRRLESGDLSPVRDFGSKLFQAMMTGDVAGAYRASLSLAERDGTGLRIRLRLSAAPGLVHIPWEFLFDPLERRFVALSVDSPIVRFLDVPGTERPYELVPPVKVLVVIASPTDFAPLNVETEWSKLKEAVRDIEARGQITLERLTIPTLAELQRALRRTYHVLHFVGHGGFDEQGQDGLLVFEDERGRGSEVSATYLSSILRDADSLRLAVLNACDGAKASLTDQFAGVAQSLLQQGVPAVVAMQFEITDEAAITFAHEFYSAFADGYPVEAAVSEARKSIFAGQNDSEWATPVLYLRSGSGPIFHIAPLPEVTPTESGDLEHAPLTPAVGHEGAVAEESTGEIVRPVDPVAGPGDSRWSTRFGRRGWAVASGLGALGLFAVVAATIFANRGSNPGPGPGVPTTASTTGQSFASFSGIWWTNSARMELIETDGHVTGTYTLYLKDNPLHTLTGDTDGDDLLGTFDGPTNHFVFLRQVDGDTFDGYWTDGSGNNHEWCGRRDKQELPEGCGYSGEWHAKGLPVSLALRDDMVRFTQTAGAARLTLVSQRYGFIEISATPDLTTLAKLAGT